MTKLLPDVKPERTRKESEGEKSNASKDSEKDFDLLEAADDIRLGEDEMDDFSEPEDEEQLYGQY